MSNPFVFYFIAFFIVLFAILTITFKNIFYSLLSAIVVFFVTAVIFYILGSEYNAVIQVAVYGVAIPVILALAVMFTNLRTQKESHKKSLGFKYAVLCILGILALAFTYLFMISDVITPNVFNINIESSFSAREVISAFSNGMYTRYVYSFEIVSVLLTIIVAALAILNKERRAK